MDERTVDCDDTSQEQDLDVEDDAGFDKLALDNIESKGSSWKLCNFTTLPRFDVVFFLYSCCYFSSLI